MDQFCPSKHLQSLKEAGITRKEARKVAVLNIQQATKLLLLLYKIMIPEDESKTKMSLFCVAISSSRLAVQTLHWLKL